MSYRTLLALHPADASPSRLASVAALARAFEAHVDALVLNLVSPIPTMTFVQSPDFVWNESFAEVLKDTEERGVEVRELFDAEGIGARVTAEVQQLGLVGETVAKAALYADLVVVDGASSSLVSGLMGGALEGALFAAGKPVLVLGKGDGAPPTTPAEAMIAWDGGREAARAVQQSLPFLRVATFVRAMIIDEGDDRELEEGVQALGTWLARHGIDIEIERVAPAGRFVHHALVEQVSKRRPDLLVMGAYGHTRIRERLFSGATRAALTDLETPLFLAH